MNGKKPKYQNDDDNHNKMKNTIKAAWLPSNRKKKWICIKPILFSITIQDQNYIIKWWQQKRKLFQQSYQWACGAASVVVAATMMTTRTMLAELCIWQPRMHTWRPIMYSNKRAPSCTPLIKKLWKYCRLPRKCMSKPSNGHACICVSILIQTNCALFELDTCQKAVMTYSNDQQTIRACHSHTDDYVRCVVLTPQVFCLWFQYVERIEQWRMHENNDNSNANFYIDMGCAIFPFWIEMLIWWIEKIWNKIRWKLSIGIWGIVVRIINRSFPWNWIEWDWCVCGMHFRPKLCHFWLSKDKMVSS